MTKKNTTTKNTTKGAGAKSASITLRRGTEILALLAMLRPDGKVTVVVTTRDTNTKASARGMTSTFASMALARTHLEALATKAIALGWERRAFRSVRKADDFDTLPAPKTVGQ